MEKFCFKCHLVAYLVVLAVATVAFYLSFAVGYGELLWVEPEYYAAIRSIYVFTSFLWLSQVAVDYKKYKLQKEIKEEFDNFIYGQVMKKNPLDQKIVRVDTTA